MPYTDKDKQREFQRDFLRNKKIENPNWYKELSKRRKQKRENIHAIVNHIKSTFGCLLCDEKDPDKLQFHHVIPELKVATIAQLVGNRSKLIIILKEIDKCVCVCTACHRQLGSNLALVKIIMKNEVWYKDWSLKEALAWSNLHPQSRINKKDILGVIKAIVRNSQIHDLKKFTNLNLWE